MQVVFVDDSTAIRDESMDDPAKRTFLLPHPPVVPIAQPPIHALNIALSDEKNESAVEASGDQAGRSALFGRYMGQISARVERAWLRPRSSPGAGGAGGAGGAEAGGVEGAHHGSFSCRVQITQDRQGTVQEVTLQECTADPRWQISLVRAINGASPLPAPPDPAVFSNLLTLEFDSDPYVAGASEDGFEPAMRASAADTMSPPDPNSEPTATPGSVTRRLRDDGSVDLTIIGARAQRGSLSN